MAKAEAHRVSKEASERANQDKKPPSQITAQSDIFHEVGRLPVEDDTQGRLVFSPDGKLLATAGIGKDQRLHLYNLLTLECPFCLEGGGHITGIAFSLDSKSFFTGCSDGTVSEWDTETQREKRRLVEPIRLSDTVVAKEVLAMALSPDAKTLAVGCIYRSDKGKLSFPVRIRILETSTGKELDVFPTAYELVEGTDVFA